MPQQLYLRTSICAGFLNGEKCAVKIACKTTIQMIRIAYISNGRMKICSHRSVFGNNKFYYFQNTFIAQLQYLIILVDLNYWNITN